MSTHNVSQQHTPPPSSLIKTMKSFHGVSAKNLIEKIVRMKIQAHTYWKEKCIGLNEESLIDRAMDLESFGGTFGGNKQPTHFLCLVLKMLQIQPEQDIILEYIKDETSKYLRLLGAFYLRLVGKPKDIYTCLEPLYNDYRTVRKRVDTGYEKVHVDVFIKELLTGNYSCDIALPHLPPRATLEQTISLPKRQSSLVENNLVDFEKIKREEKDKLLSKITSHTENIKKDNEKVKKQKEIKNHDKMDVEDNNKYKYNDNKRDDGYRDRDRYYDNRNYRDSDRYRDNRYDRIRDYDDERKRNRDSDEEEEEGSIPSSNQQVRPKKKINISKYEKGSKQVNSSTTINNNNSNNTSQDQEIAEMNEVRKKLGLAPLK